MPTHEVSEDEQLPLLTTPAGGIPRLTSSPRDLQRALESLASGTGEFSVDTERASGIRYGQRAFLIQLKRKDSGIWLIDPEAYSDLSELNAVLQEAPWILHAANQDLPCLREAGLDPPALFDTELAARLLGMPKVGLATLTEELLGIRLAKEHSAADWSKRPLPEKMLAYAALDVELLPELKEILLSDLREAKKLDIALQEFEATRTAPPPERRADPWRRVSGAHAIKQRRDLAILKELWLTREEIAESRDQAPGRILPDSALMAAVAAKPKTVPQLLAVKGLQGRNAKRDAPRWLQAVLDGLKTEDLPPRFRKNEGPPTSSRVWAQRKPEAAARLATARKRLQVVSEEHSIPLENLLTPATLRELAWSPPDVIEPGAIQEDMKNLGARPWQIDLTWAVITVAFLDPEVEES